MADKHESFSFTRCEYFSFMRREALFVACTQSRKMSVSSGLDDSEDDFEITLLNIAREFIKIHVPLKYSFHNENDAKYIAMSMIKNPALKGGTALFCTFEDTRSNAAPHACAMVCDGKNVYFLDTNSGIFRMNKSDSIETIVHYLREYLGPGWAQHNAAGKIQSNVLIELEDKSTIRELWLPGRGFKFA